MKRQSYKTERNEYIQWLHSMISNRQSYHNHKETMAWVITALYVPGIITFASYIRILEQPGWQIRSTILLIIVTYLVFCFLKMQFDMRWESADTIRILMQRLARLNEYGKLPGQDEWKIDKETNSWPNFIQNKIDESRKSKRNCPEALNALLQFFTWWQCKKNHEEKVDNRWKTELPSYLIIAIATSAAIALIWIPT